MTSKAVPMLVGAAAAVGASVFVYSKYRKAQRESATAAATALAFNVPQGGLRPIPSDIPPDQPTEAQPTRPQNYKTVAQLNPTAASLRTAQTTQTTSERKQMLDRANFTGLRGLDAPASLDGPVERQRARFAWAGATAALGAVLYTQTSWKKVGLFFGLTGGFGLVGTVLFYQPDVATRRAIRAEET